MRYKYQRMDILRKELNEIYREQGLELESLDHAVVHQCGMIIRNTADTLKGYLVILTPFTRYSI